MLWVAFVAAWGAFLGATPAHASHGETACAGAFDFTGCAAMVDELELQGDETRSVLEGGVPLDEDDSNRLELAWWGQWAIVGLLLTGFAVPVLARLLGARS